MQEAEDILFLSLREIGCNLTPAEGEESVSVAHLSAEDMVAIAARCLFLIAGESPAKGVLPPNLAARHRICASLSEGIKALGYTGECGFSQLLYPAEQTSRSILTFLVGKLPKGGGADGKGGDDAKDGEEGEGEEVLGHNALMNRRLKGRLDVWCKVPWVFPFTWTKQSTPRYTALSYHSVRKVDDADAGGTGDLHSLRPIVGFVAASIFERNAAEQQRERREEEERMIGEGEGDAKGRAARERARKNNIRKALNEARKADKKVGSLTGTGGAANASGAGAGAGGGGPGGAGAGGAGGAGGDGPRVTLNDVLRDLESDASRHDSQKGTQRSRFIHAAEFGQEKQTSVLEGSDDPARDKAASEEAAAKAAEEAKTAALSAAARAEAEEREREETLHGLEGQIETNKTQIATLEADRTRAENNVRHMEAEISQLAQLAEKLQRSYMIKRKTLEMLPQAADNIKQLQEICTGSARKVMHLAQEWERHRRPLVDQIRALKRDKMRRKARIRTLVAEIKEARAEMQRMVADLREKEERAKVLQEEYAKMPRSINRTLYTYRILDIINSINKQKKEIDKIISDIRDVQKAINSVTTTLQRTDALADERIYQAAQSKVPAMVTSYRCLNELRQHFDTLIGAVQESGSREAEARDLEKRIEQESARVSSNNMDRVLQDLAQVKRENQELMQQLRAAKARGQA